MNLPNPGTQARDVYDELCKGWTTIFYIQDMTGHSETGISARIRELRHKGFPVEKDNEGKTYYYRIAKPGEQMVLL